MDKSTATGARVRTLSRLPRIALLTSPPRQVISLTDAAPDDLDELQNGRLACRPVEGEDRAPSIDPSRERRCRRSPAGGCGHRVRPTEAGVGDESAEAPLDSSEYGRLYE